MRFETEAQAITYVFESLARTDWQNRGLDENTRNIKPTETLLRALGLPTKKREYAIVTGSKGKGSTTVITAKILQHLGHTVGTITSPHLVSYRERFRIDGRMIAEADLVRLIDELAPAIDKVVASLPNNSYLSPQGIFLAVALRWFDEQNVTAAVVEVGRGGRFDDNNLVPNMISMFTPIFREHVRYLGDSLARIAWHKAGIIKPLSYAVSVAQQPEVMSAIRAEAQLQQAQFDWIAPLDMGKYVGTDDDGVRFTLGRYGDLKINMLGRYEVENATLAVQAAGNMHARLLQTTPNLVRHSQPAYIAHVRDALADVHWPGRLQLLEPRVYIDGAINVASARSYLESVESRLTQPVVIVTAVPGDRDYNAVYGVYGPAADALILTESTRNITINFPQPDEALATARQYNEDVTHRSTLAAAVDVAREKAGADGTILLALAQPAVGDAMALWQVNLEQI